MKKAMSAKQVLEKKFPAQGFSGEWLEKYGDPEKGFSMLVYGPSGSGKSVEVLKLCDYFAKHHGRVLYNSCEEGIGKTLQDSIREFGCDADGLYFDNNLPYDELVERARKGRYAMVVIDSLQYMGLTYAQYQDFHRMFKNGRSKKAIIIISQVNGDGKVRGGEQLLHAVDIKVQIDAGRASIRSRFVKGGHKTVELFKGSHNKHKHKTLFD